eukprot:CFRG6381T1
MSPSIKLTYFDTKGRAEPARVAFAYGGIEFTDYRMEPKDWPGIKAKTPFGMVPVLEVEGQVYAEGYAILRYAGKLSGLYPEDPLQALRVDEVLAVIETSFVPALGRTFFMTDEAEKKAERERIASDVLPPFLKVLDEYAKGGYFVEDKLTIADIAMYEFIVQCAFLSDMPKDLFEKYSNIMGVAEHCKNEPKLKEYYANRK